jgi:predicted glycoside hydrolase/deacetylase ChbG (UPF0249 family)
VTAAPRLGVTADDYGLTTAVNEGIEDAARRGALTGVSVMVHPRATLAQVHRIADRAGLHLVLVEEEPILPARILGSLVGRDGRLPRDYRALLRKVLARPNLADLVRLEAEAQVER